MKLPGSPRSCDILPAPPPPCEGCAALGPAARQCCCSKTSLVETCVLCISPSRSVGGEDKDQRHQQRVCAASVLACPSGAATSEGPETPEYTRSSGEETQLPPRGGCCSVPLGGDSAVQTAESQTGSALGQQQLRERFISDLKGLK